MSSPVEQIEFRYDDWSRLVARVEGMAAAEKGWVNLVPEVEADEATAPRSRLAGLFSAAGPTVPLATWVAPTPGKPASAGVQHGLGTKAVARLREHGIEVPAGSVVVQDNPRRGLVVRLADGTDAEAVLAWLMEAVDDMCPAQLTGHWLADVHPG